MWGQPFRIQLMLDDVTDFTLQQLSDLGSCGFISGCLIFALLKVWVALQKERERCERLADKMQELSRETNTMIERITSR